MRLEDGRLRYTAPAGALTPELRTLLQARRDELIAALRGASPASAVQQRFLRLQKLNPGESFYNAPFAFEILGPLDTEVLRRSFDAVVSRHESLRTTLREDEGRLMRVVAETGGIVPETIVASPADAEAVLTEHAERPFDVAREAGLRALLVRTGDQKHILQLCFHNTLFDQTSLLVLLHELSVCYTAFAAGASPDLPTPAQYSEYVQRQQSRMQAGSAGRRAYWWDWFGDGPPPRCGWRAARPAPLRPSFQSHVTRLRCSPELTDALRDLAKRSGVTIYLVALTAYARLLARYTESADVTFGTTYSDRDDWRFGTMIGPTIQVPALRIRAGDDTDAMLAQMRVVVADALTWQDVPLDEIARELGLDVPPGPLFRAVVSYFAETPHGKLKLPGMSVRFLEERINSSSRPDLYLVLWEQDGGLAGYWMHKQDVFDVETAREMNAAFLEILTTMASGTEPA